VKQEIFAIRNLQNSLTKDLIKLEQTYNNVKITNKVEESKLEIMEVDSNSSTNGQIITIPFNEEIPSNIKGRVEQL
jgi:hypothetical protein